MYVPKKVYPELYPRNGKTWDTWYNWNGTVSGRKPLSSRELPDI